MSRRVYVLLAAVLVAGLGLSPGWAGAGLRVPGGFEVKRKVVAPGLEHMRLRNSKQRIHVAYRAAGAPNVLRVVASGPDRVFMPNHEREKPSQMCWRLHCLVGTGGDMMLDDQPIGGEVQGGEMLRSPTYDRHQMWIEPGGKIDAGLLVWDAKLQAGSDPPITVGAFNRYPPLGEIGVFTPNWARSTGTGRDAVELETMILDVMPGRLGTPSTLQMLELREGTGNTEIKGGRVVLSATGLGAELLRGLWSRRDAVGSQVTFTVQTTPNATDSLGINPLILVDGAPMKYPDADFYAGRHPRTAVGWNDHGESWLVTVDGRQKPAKGMSLYELSDLMRHLGATDAVNLDGGGGTVFVLGGKVINNPSDGGKSGKRGRERPDVNSLLVVPLELP